MPRMGGYVPADHKTRHQDGGRDEISIASLSGDPADTINESLLTTRGDMLRRSATIPERFAKGSSGQLLTMGANDPDWAAPPSIGEGFILIAPISYASIGQGTWSWSGGAYMLGGAWGNGSKADDDNITYNLYLAKGTYTMEIFFVKGADRAIADFYIGATEVGSQDMYATSDTATQCKTITGIVIAADVLTTITVRAHGKNASSTYYRMPLEAIVLWRTA